MAETINVPAEATEFRAPLDLFEAPRLAEDDQATAVRSFRGKVNTGKPILGHWWWGNLGFDMKGVKVSRQDMPVLRDHDPNRILGYTTKVTAGESGVDAEGKLLDVTEAGREVSALLGAGMPLQMSMQLTPTKVLKLRDGEEIEVNGHKLRGPGHVFQKSELREVTITATGADSQTHVASLSNQRGHTVEVQLHEEDANTMSKTDEATPLSAASLKERHPDVFGEVSKEARAEGFALGVQKERERIAFINSKRKGVGDDLVATAITEGWGKEQTLSAFCDFLAERKEARLDAIRKESPQPVGSDDPETFAEGRGASPSWETLPEGEERWRAEFAAKPELREEFCNDEELYLAYKGSKLGGGI